MPEHDLTLVLVWGEHTSEEAIQFLQSLDESCATRWLGYWHPSVDMSKIDVAHLPAMKRIADEKRRELFGDKPKACAIVCGSDALKDYFDFWSRYSDVLGAAFGSLEEAYDWLDLSEAARSAVSRVMESWTADVEVGDLSPDRSLAGASAGDARATPSPPAR